MANFKRLRYTNKEDGTQVRALGVNVTNLTKDVKTEDTGLIVFSDVKGSIYMAMEAKEFKKGFVEGWKSKLELGLEKVEEIIDDIKDKVEDIVEDINEVADEIIEGAGDIKDAIEDTVEDIKDILDGDSEEDPKIIETKEKPLTKKELKALEKESKSK